MHAFSRSELLLSTKGIETLKKKHIAIFGLGGVGSYIVETLARSGIEHFTLIDNDIITISNLNRQLYALTSTMNKKKIEVAKNRTLDINPNCQIQIYDTFPKIPLIILILRSLTILLMQLIQLALKYY